ncbi:unnamed protein product, partial [Polarella glacialis]
MTSCSTFPRGTSQFRAGSAPIESRERPKVPEPTVNSEVVLKTPSRPSLSNTVE